MEKTGVGQRVQACLSRSGGLTQLPFMLDYEGKVWDEPAGPEAKGYGPLDRIFRTADGWFYLVAESPAALRAIPLLSGLPEEPEALAKALETMVSQGGTDAWLEVLKAPGVGPALPPLPGGAPGGGLCQGPGPHQAGIPPRRGDAAHHPRCASAEPDPHDPRLPLPLPRRGHGAVYGRIPGKAGVLTRTRAADGTLQSAARIAIILHHETTHAAGAGPPQSGRLILWN